MSTQSTIVIICGATGVGKTDFSLILGRALHAEIINVDMGQFYTPLTIGTAKPDWKAMEIQHHAFDIMDKPTDFTVAAYRTHASKLIPEIQSRGHVPLFVGGSTLYVSSLFFPPTSRIKSTNFETSLSEEQLWNYLYQIDPVRAEEIHPRDIYRIKRALAIWEATGTKPSVYEPIFDPIWHPFIFIRLFRDRDDLYERINQRVQAMINQGWIEEVQALLGSPWEPFLLKKKLIGYDDIMRYLALPKAEQNIQNLSALIAQKTRNYAKRQMTFWRMLEKKISEYLKNYPHSSIYSINLTTTPIDEYVDTILSSVA